MTQSDGYTQGESFKVDAGAELGTLPRYYADAARQSISVYVAQIAELERVLNDDAPSAELQIVTLRTAPLAGSVAHVWAISEEQVIEMIAAQINAKIASINVLRDALGLPPVDQADIMGRTCPVCSTAYTGLDSTCGRVACVIVNGQGS